MQEVLIVAAVVGLASGVVCGVLALFLKQPQARQVLLFVPVLLASVGAGTREFRHPLALAVMNRLGLGGMAVVMEIRMREEPELVAWVTAKAKAGTKPDAAQGQMQTLVASGLARLDDALLISRLQVMRELVENADQATCAGLAKGRPSMEGMDAAFRQMPRDSREAFAEFATRAALAEIRDSTPPRLTQAQLNAGRLALLGRDPERTGRLVETVAQLDDAQACQLARDLYGNALTALMPDRAYAARVIVMSP